MLDLTAEPILEAPANGPETGALVAFGIGGPTVLEELDEDPASEGGSAAGGDAACLASGLCAPPYRLADTGRAGRAKKP